VLPSGGRTAKPRDREPAANPREREPAANPRDREPAAENARNDKTTTNGGNSSRQAHTTYFGQKRDRPARLDVHECAVVLMDRSWFGHQPI
jgi:hypothetical protein